MQKLSSGRHEASVEKAVDWLKRRTSQESAVGATEPAGQIATGAEHALWLGNRQCVTCHFHVPEPTVAASCVRNSEPAGTEAYLGVALARVPSVLRQHVKMASRMGLLVESVDAASPAQQAGVQQYDIVERIDGQWLVNPEQFAVLMRTFAPSSELALTVVQQGESKTIAVRLAERPHWNGEGRAAGHGLEPAPSLADAADSAEQLAELYHHFSSGDRPTSAAAWLGVECIAPPAALVKQLKLAPGMGLLVDVVLADSPARTAGLKRHDLLQKLDEQLLVNQEQFSVLVGHRRPGERVKLSLLRDGQPLMLEASLADRDPASAAAERDAPGSLERWKESFLARWSNERANDELFLQRLYAELLGTAPAAAESEQFVADTRPDKRAAAIDRLLAEPAVVSRLSGQAAARWIDAVHQISLSKPDGRWRLRAETLRGEKLFDGPVETEAERQRLPAELRAKLTALESRLTAESASSQSSASTTGLGAEEVLAQIIPKVDFQLVTLPEAVEQLRAATGANLVLHARALRGAGADLDEKFSLTLSEVRLSTVLKTVLALSAGDTPLEYRIQDEVILLTSQTATSKMH